MAIPDAGKLFEAETPAQTIQTSLGLAIKAGTQILIGIAGKRSGASLGIAQITDSKGNSWDWEVWESSYRMGAVAYCHTPVAMDTTDWIRIRFNGKPSYAWLSAHAFEGAGGTPTDADVRTGFGDSITVPLTVTGSDWLTFAVMMLPDDYGVTATPLNSSVAQDDNANSTVAPWAECFSRNGTTGSTHSIGASIPADVTYTIVGVSFPYEAMPAGRSFAAMAG